MVPIIFHYCCSYVFYKWYSLNLHLIKSILSKGENTSTSAKKSLRCYELKKNKVIIKACPKLLHLSKQTKLQWLHNLSQMEIIFTTLDMTVLNILRTSRGNMLKIWSPTLQQD
jgi:hypothetical protein